MAKLTIEYFIIKCLIDDQLELTSPKTDAEVKQDFWNKIVAKANDCIKNTSSNYYTIKNSDNFIEFIEVDDNYIFGILGKSDEVTAGILKRIRNKENVETGNLFLEKYNYFLLRREDYSVNVIRNSQSPGFKRPFTTFLSDIECHRMKNLNVVRKLDKDIDTKIKKMKTILEISMIFNQDSNIGNQLLSIKDTFHISNNNLIKANIQISLKNQPVPKELECFLSENEQIKSDFEKLKIVGNSSEGQETIELVGQLLSKTIEIEIEDDDVIKNKLDKIKKALEESFSN